MKHFMKGVIGLGLVLVACPVSAEPRLTGRVTDYAGRAVYQADLDFYRPGTKTKADVQPPGSPAQSEKTNFNGQYTLLVVAGEYDIRYQPPAGRNDLASILLRNISVLADTAVNIVLPRGYPLTGFVRDVAGNGVAGVDIDVVDQATGRRVPTPGDNSGGSGAYQVIVVPGTYTVHFTPPAGVRLAPASIVEVAVNGITRLDMVLERGYEVSGRVTDAIGQPLGGVDLDVDAAGSGARLRTSNDVTTPDGRFALIVPAGTFDVTFSPPASSQLAAFALRGVDVQHDVVLADVLLTSGIEIRARMTGPSGVSLAGAKALFFEASSGIRYPTPHAVSDEPGQFGPIRVPAGSYHVRIALPPHLALDTLDVGTRLFDRDVNVVWDLEVGSLFTLSIETRVAGVPAGASIQVWHSPQSGAVLATAITDPEGLARVVLPAGIYDLLIRPESGLQPDSLLIESVALAADLSLVLNFSRRIVDPPSNRLVHSPFMPNPFRSTTRLMVTGVAEADITVSLYDLEGRLVRRMRIPGASGNAEVVWDGKDDSGQMLPGGVYLARLEAPGRSASARVVRLR